MLIEKATILEGARQAFFKAMLDGYAGGTNRESVKTVSPDGHTKTITFTDGDYVVKDEWHTTPYSDCSAGTTTIFHRGVPIWWMSYGGRYPKGAIPFLKEALKKNYEKGVFHLGRGPESYDGRLTGNTWLKYRCIGMVSGWYSFDSFHGFEDITEISGVRHPDLQVENQLGFHYFSGMSML